MVPKAGNGISILTRVRTCVRMPEYRYTVAEYDPARPWVLVGALRQLTVELDEGEDFAAWAARAWPRPRYQVHRLPELGPWQGAG